MSFASEKSYSLNRLYDRLQPDVKGHCVRVAVIMQILFETALVHAPLLCGDWKQLEKDTAMSLIRECGFYHDLGKMLVPRQILMCRGKLTPQEYAQVKKHTIYIEQLLPPNECESLRNQAFLTEISEVGLSHHERWDGTGYPYGLAQEEIPFVARICAFADTYDAITGGRVYSPKQTSEVAMREIQRCAGTQFDPELAKVFRLCSPKLKELTQANGACR